MHEGGICCWRQSESRNHKNLDRVLCDKRMALIVDDTVDVWQDDLANLCLIRRFVGDPKDDGLMRLAWQLQLVHRNFFAEASKLDTPPLPTSAACYSRSAAACSRAATSR